MAGDACILVTVLLTFATSVFGIVEMLLHD
uniref:Mutant cadherin n=1 Tax=Pectinophora gossypiella TaxID=13191 RepID=A0A060BJF8_PECGO|nr:mutant cadherin [Pectinophora gossypiella]AIA80605.1 mutant cadherin [Pectinophora gossypiella]